MAQIWLMDGTVAKELKRLREATRPRLSTREVARTLGMPHTSYTYYEGKFKEPNLPVPLAKALAPLFAERGVPAGAVLRLAGLDYGGADEQMPVVEINEDLEQGMARVDELDVRGSAGGGSAMDDAEAPTKIHEWRIPREMIRAATYAPAERIKIITVVGDSMEETFRPYERVMVDTSDTVPTPPGVFVVYDGLGLVVKRVEHIPHSDPPRVKISSDNPRYSPYERTLGEAYIHGRVLGRWQWV